MISTRDLLAMDALLANMGNMHLHPSQNPNYLSSQHNVQGYLPPTSSPQLLTAGPRESEYSSSANPEYLGSAPRYVPPAPMLGSSPTYQDIPPPRSRLAPDAFGNEIPPDAQWTKVRRTLISPEILHRAGVRYEARPDFVAILGRLSRDQIAEFARQSADARAARSNNYHRQAPSPSRHQGSQPQTSNGANGSSPPLPPRPSSNAYYDTKGRSRSNSDPNRSRDNKTDQYRDIPVNHTRSWDSERTKAKDEEESIPGDESDAQSSISNDTKPYRYIVDPPSKKTSPNSTAQPKSILKNKNENHVHFGPNPYEVSPDGRSSQDDRRRSRDPPRNSRDANGRDSSTRYGGSGSSNGRRRDDRYESSSSSRYPRDSRDSKREKERGRKKAWGETMGAVGIGGAAVTLLGVLAEASLGIS